MDEKGFPAMMVGYALNHGVGTYRLYNPKTKRIIMSRNIKWMDFQSRKLEDEFNLFEPGIKSVESDVYKTDSEDEENSTISTQNTKETIKRKKVQIRENRESDTNSEESLILNESAETAN